MNLSELIRLYGDDKVQFQNLDQCTEALNMNKGITKITFGTEQPIGLDGTAKLGLVMWFDRDQVAKIIADEKAGVTSPGPIAAVEADRAEQWRQRRDAEGIRDAARAAADSLRHERDALTVALTQISQPSDCGCKPCTGQCRSEESLSIELDAIRDIARAALRAVNGGEL